jgi:hypothetical protein
MGSQRKSQKEKIEYLSNLGILTDGLEKTEINRLFVENWVHLPKDEPFERENEEPKGEPWEEPQEEPKGEPKEEPKGEPKEEPKGEPWEEPQEEPKGEPKEEPKEKPKEKPKEEPKDDISFGSINEFEAANEMDEKIKSSTYTQENKKGATKPLLERKQKKISKTQSDPNSFRVGGYMLLLVTDTAFPFLFSYIHNMFEKRFSMQFDELQLEEKQMDELTMLANQAADYLSININPVAGFIIMSAFMYGQNFFILRSQKVAMLPEAEIKEVKRKPIKKEPKNG